MLHHGAGYTRLHFGVPEGGKQYLDVDTSTMLPCRPYSAVSARYYLRFHCCNGWLVLTLEAMILLVCDLAWADRVSLHIAVYRMSCLRAIDTGPGPVN